jgi:hypothetical protein
MTDDDVILAPSAVYADIVMHYTRFFKENYSLQLTVLNSLCCISDVIFLNMR